MKIEVNISKRYFFIIFGVFLLICVGFAVYAYHSSGTGGNPAVAGHSVDEMDWSKQIPGNIDVSGSLCIQGDCRSSWPQGSSGISLTAGPGIILNPDPITGSGSISANTNYLQRRVSAGCGAGYAIQAIQADGTPSCVSIQGSSCYWSSRQYSVGAVCRDSYTCQFNALNTVHTCLSGGSWSTWNKYVHNSQDCPDTC